MEVTVSDVTWNPESSRRAEVLLTDSTGNSITLVDYSGANNSAEWAVGYRYRISNCKVLGGSSGENLYLAPSKKTRIEALGPESSDTQLLIIGDTHIGREEHPGTGQSIDPINALAKAVKYGIDRGVDAVVHVGDIFHDSAIEKHGAVTQLEVFNPLIEAGIPFYFIRGNHASEAGEKLLDVMTDQLARHLDTNGIAVDSDTRIFGIDHVHGTEFSPHQYQFPQTVPESTNVLVLHQRLKQLSGANRRNVDLNQLQRQFSRQFDAVVCGHQHDGDRTMWNGIPVLYTGASEFMSINEGSNDRIAWLLSVEDHRVNLSRYDIP